MRKILHNAFKVVHMFEEEVANYTGAKYAVAVDSCTNAIFLSCYYSKNVLGIKETVLIPIRTYLSVPQAVQQAGIDIMFENRDWSGVYQILPYPVWDSAKRFTSNMYIPNSFMCLSFHMKKPLPIGKGGMILTDDETAYKWFYRAKLEGREEKSYHEDDLIMSGWNFYMTPEEAARGLMLMQNYPEHSPDQGEVPPYRKLSEFAIFRNIPICQTPNYFRHA